MSTVELRFTEDRNHLPSRLSSYLLFILSSILGMNEVSFGGFSLFYCYKSSLGKPSVCMNPNSVLMPLYRITYSSPVLPAGTVISVLLFALLIISASHISQWQLVKTPVFFWFGFVFLQIVLHALFAWLFHQVMFKKRVGYAWLLYFNLSFTAPQSPALH